MKRWLTLVCFAAALFCLAYPLYVIRPFRHQGAGELALALQVIEYRFPIALLCCVIALALTVFTRSKLAAVFTLLTIACAALTKINVYEQMFHPLGQPQFLTIAQAQLAPDEKVIAVTLNNTARAYPVRGISYHHIVNDTLNGVPIVATY